MFGCPLTAFSGPHRMSWLGSIHFTMYWVIGGHHSSMLRMRLVRLLAPTTACSLLAGCGIYSLLNKTIIVISDLKDSRASLWCDSSHQKLNYPEWLKIKQQQRRHLDTAGKLLTWMKMCSFLKICFNNAMLIAKLQTFQGLSVSTGRKAGFWHVRWLEESPVLIIYWIQWNHSYFSTFLEPCINQNTSVKKKYIYIFRSSQRLHWSLPTLSQTAWDTLPPH